MSIGGCERLAGALENVDTVGLIDHVADTLLRPLIERAEEAEARLDRILSGERGEHVIYHEDDADDGTPKLRREPKRYRCVRLPDEEVG